MTSVADRLELGSPRSRLRIQIRDRLLGRFRMRWRAEDELDVLAGQFNRMLERLEKTYAELQSAQRTLLQSEKLAAVGTLAAGIAHEVNNPIAGLQNCIRRLSRDPGNVDQNRQYLAIMSEAADRVEKVVQGLLNFTRKHEVQFQDISIPHLIENALTLAGHRLEKANITIERNFPLIVPTIRGDAHQLEQVFVNLILNAVDAIHERVRSEQVCPKVIRFLIQPNADVVRCEITDTGHGISEEHIQHVFDPFFTTKKVGEGTGLGLSVSYRIIKDHGGDISVRSQTGLGTQFTIVFPTGK